MPGHMLEIFSGSGSMAAAFSNAGYIAHTLDFHQYRKAAPLTFKTDILLWDYKSITPDTYSFLFIGLPCTTFSIASHGYHFKNGLYALTPAAKKSIEIIKVVASVIKHFAGATVVLENPAGGLCNNFYYQAYISRLLQYMYRVPLGAFGFPTTKKTDLFTNNSNLVLVPAYYRCNGRYSKISFDSLSQHQRQEYPAAFCAWVVASFANV